MKRWNKCRIWFGLLLCMLLGSSFTGCQEIQENISIEQQEEVTTKDQGKTTAKASAKMKVHFIDVGQGSATLIESKGHFMLMDGGDSETSSKVVSYLKKQGVKKLDYVIVSHYDSDHLHGVVGALNAFKTDYVIAPKYEEDTKVYESFVQVMKQKKITSIKPKVGKKYKLGKAKFTILAPNGGNYSDVNNYSVAIRLVNGSNQFVITGDAEAESEYEILENKLKLSCDVFAAGHHGSANSSSQKFLQAMNPKYIVVSAGADNTYGHPSQEAMSRFKSIGAKILRTDEQGTVIATSNGKKITWNKKPSTTWAYREYGSSTSIGGKVSAKETATSEPVEKEKSGQYIGNKNSKKYHSTDCGSLPYEENRIYFTSLQEAEDAGYTPCSFCAPK